MLGAKYGFAQSMDCAAQTMDPYFARAIYGLCSHSVRVHLLCARKPLGWNAMRNPCMCMACINQLASYIALHPRHIVYPRTGPAREPGPLPEPKAKGRGDAARTETGSLSSFSGLLLNGIETAARW